MSVCLPTLIKRREAGLKKCEKTSFKYSHNFSYLDAILYLLPQCKQNMYSHLRSQMPEIPTKIGHRDRRTANTNVLVFSKTDTKYEKYSFKEKHYIFYDYFFLL